MKRGAFLCLLCQACALLIASPAEARPRSGTIRDASQPAEVPSQPAGLFGAAQGETTYFGGTVWSVTNSRWEAIQGGTWTFDSGIGSTFTPHPDSNPYKDPSLHTLMEGWIGIDNTFTENSFFRRLQESDFTGAGVCVGDVAGLGGDWSFWAGVLPEEADALCWASGQGYGDAWDVCITKEYTYNGIGNVILTYDFVAETEPGFDYTFAIVDTTCSSNGSHEVTVGSTTGSTSGNANFVLTKGVNLRSNAGCIRILFCVTSDGAYSDQDGGYPTACGAFAIDNVAVTGGGINDVDTFEAGDEGWALGVPRPGYGGEWSDIRGIGSLPPMQKPCPSLADSVLVFEDLTTGVHNNFQNNMAASPWIDLLAAGLVGATNKQISFEGYFELPLINYLFVQSSVQWYPAVCPATGELVTSPWTSDGFFYYFGGGPTCRSVTNPVRLAYGAVMDAGAEQVRIALGAFSYCNFFPGYYCTSNSTTPWFDNVRFCVVSPDIALISPNGGQCWAVGSNVSITWTAVSPAVVDNVDLRLSRTGPSGPFEDIALGLPNTGSFPWTVTGPATSDAYFQLTTHDQSSGTCTDLSNAAFEIKVYSPGTGACCITTSAGTGCDITTEQACCNAGGTYYGDGSECVEVTAALVTEPGGTIFVHQIGPPGGCPEEGGGLFAQASAEPTAPPYYDGWVSNANQVQCHHFDAGPQSPPIPADFFGPGSDPFTGWVCLQGEPLGGPYENLDTVIEREGDPFERCALPGPTQETVMIQIVELNLRSTLPIRVTYNGGGSPQEWDVHVDLSDIPTPPGTLTAKKTHCNGGTYTSTLPVQPRFTFTQVGNPGEVRVLDTGLEAIPPVVLNQPNAQHWTTDIGILDDPIILQTSHFHPGYRAEVQSTACDVDSNGVLDDCQTLSSPNSPIPVGPILASPNPFLAQTTVQFVLETDVDARIAVFDMAGRLVRVLHSGDLKAGVQSVDWNGQDEHGRGVSAGIYLIRIAAGSFVQEAKVLRIQ